MTALPNFFRSSRRPLWASLVCAATSVLASGCAQVLPPPEVLRAVIANPEPSLHLVDAEHWRIFEVAHTIFGRRLVLREEAATPAEPGDSAPAPLVVPWKGDAGKRSDWATFWISHKFYARYHHSGNYRIRHPWSGEEWVLATRAVTHRARSFSLPVTEEEAPSLAFFEADDEDHERPLGQLTYDVVSRRLLFGRLQEQEVEIERVGTLAFDRERGLLQQWMDDGTALGGGEFVIRIGDRETARLLMRHDGGATDVTFRLAIRNDLEVADRDLTLWMFFAFDRMVAFLRGTD